MCFVPLGEQMLCFEEAVSVSLQPYSVTGFWREISYRHHSQLGLFGGWPSSVHWARVEGKLVTKLSQVLRSSWARVKGRSWEHNQAKRRDL